MDSMSPGEASALEPIASHQTTHVVEKFLEASSRSTGQTLQIMAKRTILAGGDLGEKNSEAGKMSHFGWVAAFQECGTV
jgi:hypothetical protein